MFSNSLDKWVQTVCVVPRKGVCAQYAGDVTDAEIEYEEHYSCCPPPLFMIIITVLEVIKITFRFEKIFNVIII